MQVSTFEGVTLWHTSVRSGSLEVKRVSLCYPWFIKM